MPGCDSPNPPPGATSQTITVSRDTVTSRLLSGLTWACSAPAPWRQRLTLGPPAGSRIDIPEHDPARLVDGRGPRPVGGENHVADAHLVRVELLRHATRSVVERHDAVEPQLGRTGLERAVLTCNRPTVR